MKERSAKEIVVKPIPSDVANRFIIATHYSGRVVKNSQLHFGVFMDKRLEGVIQLGPSMDKKKVIGLVRDTPWNGFLEINRIAFTDYLPRNSESRALSIVMKIVAKKYPAIKWVLTYADACQCGDGAIYRASNFVLTEIKKNYNLRRTKDGSAKVINGRWDYKDSKPLPGFQLRYIYFIDPAWRSRLAVDELPFSEIAKRGALMARGVAPHAMGLVPVQDANGKTHFIPLSEARELGVSAGASGEEPGVQPGQGGSTPTPPLQSIFHVRFGDGSIGRAFRKIIGG